MGYFLVYQDRSVKRDLACRLRHEIEVADQNLRHRVPIVQKAEDGGRSRLQGLTRAALPALAKPYVAVCAYMREVEHRLSPFSDSGPVRMYPRREALQARLRIQAGLLNFSSSPPAK